MQIWQGWRRSQLRQGWAVWGRGEVLCQCQEPHCYFLYWKVWPDLGGMCPGNLSREFCRRRSGRLTFCRRWGSGCPEQLLSVVRASGETVRASPPCPNRFCAQSILSCSKCESFSWTRFLWLRRRTFQMSTSFEGWPLKVRLIVGWRVFLFRHWAGSCWEVPCSIELVRFRLFEHLKPKINLQYSVDLNTKRGQRPNDPVIKCYLNTRQPDHLKTGKGCHLFLSAGMLFGVQLVNVRRGLLWRAFWGIT